MLELVVAAGVAAGRTALGDAEGQSEFNAKLGELAAAVCQRAATPAEESRLRRKLKKVGDASIARAEGTLTSRGAPLDKASKQLVADALAQTLRDAGVTFKLVVEQDASPSRLAQYLFDHASPLVHHLTTADERRMWPLAVEEAARSIVELVLGFPQLDPEALTVLLERSHPQPAVRQNLGNYLNQLVNQLTLSSTKWLTKLGVDEDFSAIYAAPRLEAWDRRASALQTISLDELRERLMANHGVAISGHAGAGKSTLLNFLALDMAKAALGELEHRTLWDALPVVIRAGKWRKAGSPSLLSFIAAEAMEDAGDARAWLMSHLHRVVVFVDGLDEISEAEQVQIEAALSSSLKDIKAFVLTYRPHRVPPPWTTRYTILPLDEDGQRRLLTALGAKDVPSSIQLLRRSRHIAGSPLQLTLLALLGDEGHAALSTPADLFDKVIKRLVKGDAIHHLRPPVANPQSLLDVLKVAAWQFLVNGRLDWSEIERTARDRRVDIDELVSVGVLEMDHRGLELEPAGFVHQSFAEYLAASHAASRPFDAPPNYSFHETVEVLGADGTSYWLSQLLAEPAALQKFARSLCDDLSVQQFIYDIGALGPLALKLTSVLQSERRWDPRARLLLGKLHAHALYGDEEGETARRALRDLLGFIDGLDAVSVDPQVALWYRVWALDHLNNLGENVDVLSVLPSALRRRDKPESVDDLRLLVRASHCWSHAGNQVLRRGASGEGDVGELLSALGYYRAAAAYRVCSMASSFPEVAVEVASLLETIDPPRWLGTYVAAPLEPPSGVIPERFPNAAQAVGDTAHQVVSLGLVHCWAYALAGRNEDLSGAQRMQDVGTQLWQVAASHAARGERIRYVLRLAALRASLGLCRTDEPSRVNLSELLAHELNRVRIEFDAEGMKDNRSEPEMGRHLGLLQAKLAVRTVTSAS